MTSKTKEQKKRTVTIKPGPGALFIEGGAVTVDISKIATSKPGKEMLFKVGKIREKKLKTA